MPKAHRTVSVARSPSVLARPVSGVASTRAVVKYRLPVPSGRLSVTAPPATAPADATSRPDRVPTFNAVTVSGALRFTAPPA